MQTPFVVRGPGEIFFLFLLLLHDICGRREGDLPMHELRRGQPARGMAAHEGGWGLPCWLTGGIGRWVIVDEGGGFLKEEEEEFSFLGFFQRKKREEKGELELRVEKTHSGGGGRGRRELSDSCPIGVSADSCPAGVP